MSVQYMHLANCTCSRYLGVVWQLEVDQCSLNNYALTVPISARDSVPYRPYRSGTVPYTDARTQVPDNSWATDARTQYRFRTTPGQLPGRSYDTPFPVSGQLLFLPHSSAVAHWPRSSRSEIVIRNEGESIERLRTAQISSGNLAH